MNFPIQCPVCQGNVVLPVHFTCFPCKSSCGESYCVCLKCARQYLQMDNKGKRDYRALQRKCLYCPAVTRLCAVMDESTCLRKNRIYMQLDTAVYPCLSDGCDFCGTQCELERHLEKDCRYRPFRCLCGVTFQAKDASSHFKTCSHYKKCVVCNEYLPYDDLPSHQRLQHGLVSCGYVGCSEILSLDRVATHMASECRHRLVPCVVCQQKRTADTLQCHMERHVEDSREEVARLKKNLDVAETRRQTVATAYALFMKKDEKM